MISPLTLRRLAAVVDGELKGRDETFVSVSTDSRTIQCGALFIALKGPNFDGGRYVASAAESGAVAAVVEEFQSVGVPQVKVVDALAALGDLAGHNRKLFDGKVVAVTGSSGKTSVKEMLSRILGDQGKTLSTTGNLNNAIGAPITLLGIAAEHQYAVIELGASKVGEIAYTARLARPDVAILTNAANAHLEGFGSYENIVAAKGEIIEALGNNGTAILNADDSACENWRQMALPRRVVTFSLHGDKKADVWAESITLSATSSQFELCWREGRLSVSLPLPGNHNVANALAASCGARALGVGWQDIQHSLAALESVKGRLQITHAEAGYTVIDDTYNANPSSTQAALEVLARSKGYRVAILGDMAELGSHAVELHEQIGAYAKAGRADALYACGQYAEALARGYGEGARSFATKTALLASLTPALQPGSIYLVKGSRGAVMEEIVQKMLNQKVVA